MTLRHGEILCDACDGYLSISGIDLVGGDARWCAYDLSGILTDTSTRGANVMIPGFDGALPFQHRADETRYLLPFAITGWFDTAGAPVDESLVQAARYEAMAELEASIIGVPDPNDPEGTRPAIYDSPDGETYTADVQTLPFRRRRTAKGLWVGHLEIIVPKPWEAVP